VEAKKELKPYRKGAAICAIQKWSLNIIDEWIDYNLHVVGFETIFLYDNSDNFELEEWLKARGDSDSGRIQIKHFPGLNMQMESYNKCGTSIRDSKSHLWIGFIDLDEYIVIQDTKKYPWLMDFLDTVPDEAGGLAVNWLMYATNNIKYEPKPLPMRNQVRDSNPNQHVKTIARAEFFHGMPNPHYVAYKPRSDGIRTAVDSNWRKQEGPFNDAGPVDQIYFAHYYSKSLEEFRSRCARGRADTGAVQTKNNSVPCLSAEEIIATDAVVKDGDVFDNTVWARLKERVPKYSLFEKTFTSNSTNRKE